MVRIGDMLRMDETGRFTTSGKGVTAAEALVTQPSESSTEERRVSEADDQVVLVDPEDHLCGYYATRQVLALPERVGLEETRAVLRDKPTSFRRLQLLRDSFDNPGISRERRSEVASLIIKLAAEERVKLEQEEFKSKGAAEHGSATERTSASDPRSSPRGAAKNDMYVTRDANGVYLGMGTEREARLRWPGASLKDAVIAVAATVPVGDARALANRPLPRETGYSPRVNSSLVLAKQYTAALGRPARRGNSP